MVFKNANQRKAVMAKLNQSDTGVKVESKKRDISPESGTVVNEGVTLNGQETSEEVLKIYREFPEYIIDTFDNSFIALRSKDNKASMNVLVHRGSLGDFNTKFFVDKQGEDGFFCRTKLFHGNKLSPIVRVKKFISQKNC